MGASSGGVEAVERLLRGLPQDFPASLLIVLHRAPDLRNMLAHILQRAGRLPVTEAQDGERLQPGHIFLAPPDRHLVIEDGIMRLVRGPKENHSRPAIDPLFRSAAQTFGSRVAGVILSGTLFDGTAGLFAVKRHNGVTIVQDPQEAAFSGMPESAIGNVPIDYVLPVAGIAGLLVNLVRGIGETKSREEAEKNPAISSEGEEFKRSPEIIVRDRSDQISGEQRDEPSLFTCPDCGGMLRQVNEGALLQFRCSIGHVYTGEAMALGQSEALERSLWFSIRTFVDKSVLLRHLSEEARLRGDIQGAERLLADTEAALAHSQIIQQVLQEDRLPRSTE